MFDVDWAEQWLWNQHTINEMIKPWDEWAIYSIDMVEYIHHFSLLYVVSPSCNGVIFVLMKLNNSLSYITHICYMTGSLFYICWGF